MQVEDNVESDRLDAQSEVPENPEIVVSTPHHAWAEALGEIEADCVKAARAALACGLSEIGCALPSVEISIVLADDVHVRDLNRQHRGRDAATDVLSFPAMTAEQIIAQRDPAINSPVLLGDIVLAFETVGKNAGEQGKSLHDHVCHLVAHGVLHLLGFDHDCDDGAARMEGLERTALGQLGIGDPYVIE